MPSDAPQPESAPPPATPKPAVRDLREDFVPGDPLGTHFGGESISAHADPAERIALLARGGAEPGLTLEERNYARRIELAAVLVCVSMLMAALIWLYWRRGRVNFAGHAHNRE